jgi:hypothetical protein
MLRYERVSALLCARVLSVAAALTLSWSCTEEVQVGRLLGGAGSSTVPSAGRGGTSGAPALPEPDAAADAAPPVVTPDCVPARCGNVTLACGNCMDDDEDGRADAADAECLGPCDDSEEELFTGDAPRVNGSCRTDCYFDRNSGSGDDGCGWSYSCDPAAVAPDFPPTGLRRCTYDPAAVACQLSSDERLRCQQGCLPLTPNGCDCFGCCQLPAASGRYVWLGSENLDLEHCEIASAEDPSRCKPCTPVVDCFNDCAECELCVGKTRLPASCGVAGAPPLCPGSQRACDPQSGTGCSRLEYCITGCCVPLPT